MPDTVRTVATLQAMLSDGAAAHSTNRQLIRDLLVSLDSIAENYAIDGDVTTLASAADYTDTAVEAVQKYPLLGGETGVTDLTYPYGDVRRYGAVGDGSADDATVLNALLAMAPTGWPITFPQGYNFKTSVPLVWSGKKLHLYLRGATITEASKLTSMIHPTSADGSTIEGGTFVGTETAAGYVATERNAAVLVTTSDGVVVSGLNVTGKTAVVDLVECTNSVVKECRGVGTLLTDTASSNGTSAYRVAGGSGNTIENNYCIYFGDGILAGFSTADQVDNKFLNNRIRSCWDNGIYISSGNRSLLQGNDIQDCLSTVRTPSGIKVRGVEHKILGNTCRNGTVGIGASGNGTVNDGFVDTDGFSYYNGNGTIIQGNTLNAIQKYGIQIFKQDVDGSGNNLFPRNFIVASNSLENCGQSGFTPINVAGGSGHRIVDNTIRGSYKVIDGSVTEITTSILMAGSTTAPNLTNQLEPVVKGNTIYTAAASTFSIIQFATGGGVGCKRIIVADNNMISTADPAGLKMDGVTGARITGNNVIGNGSETGILIATTCTDIMRAGNSFDPRGRNITAVGTGAGTAATDLQTLTIAKANMGYQGGVRIVASGTVTGTTSTKTVRLLWGGAVIATLAYLAVEVDDWVIEAVVLNNAAANAQKIAVRGWQGGNITVRDYITAGANTANAVIVKTTGQTPNAADEVTSEILVIEPILQS